MIVDTTYLLPYSRMGVTNDLFSMIEERGIPVENVGISSISLFELQAKAAKIGVPARYVVDAIDAIRSEFRTENIHSLKIIEVAAGLLKRLNDYIDCLVLATAIVLKEDLVTEDSKIHELKDDEGKVYGIRVLYCKEFLELAKG